MFPLFCVLISAVVAGSQVHLSYNGDPSEMTVTWHSFEPPTSLAQVSYGTDSSFLTTKATATVTQWNGPGLRYTMRANMTGLVPGQTYYYIVGWMGSNSQQFSFKALNPSQPLRAAVFGDFSLFKGYAMSALQKGAEAGQFDIVFHIGDLAYDLNSDNGTVGDQWMDAMEPIMSKIPYQVIAGNHESDNNFLHISNRFTMPQNGITADNQFWSFDMGNVHFVGLSSEYYGFNITNLAQAQYKWLLNDFKNSNAVWKIAFMHRPMYCSNQDIRGCHKPENLLTREGAPGLPALEPLFNNGGVDVVFWGHQHSYERNYPVFESHVFSQADINNYHNAQTPVYIMTGAAGCHDHQFAFDKVKQPYTATMLSEYGFTLLTINSSTQLHTVFIDQHEKEHDDFTLSKDIGYRPGQSFVPVL